jgi:hypothetical protein
MKFGVVKMVGDLQVLPCSPGTKKTRDPSLARKSVTMTAYTTVKNKVTRIKIRALNLYTSTAFTM